MPEYNPTTLGDRLRAISEDDSTPGPDGARWPGAPEPRTDEDGVVVNAEAWCDTCESPSTLVYRCSECGGDLVGSTAADGTGGAGR